jgi:hypothetical protein
LPFHGNRLLWIHVHNGCDAQRSDHDTNCRKTARQRSRIVAQVSTVTGAFAGFAERTQVAPGREAASERPGLATIPHTGQCRWY